MFIINVLTGELCHRVRGPFLPGPLAVDFSRAYSSASSHMSSLGFGWNAPYDIRLVRKGSMLLMYDGSDELDRFDSPAGLGHVVEGKQHLLQPLGANRWSVDEKENKKKTYEWNETGGNIFLTRIKDSYWKCN